MIGEDAGQFSVEGQGDLNFRLFNDTVRLEANAEGQFLGLANITGGVLKVEKLFVERNEKD